MTHELKEIQKTYLENVKDAARKKVTPRAALLSFISRWRPMSWVSVLWCQTQANTDPDPAKIAADKEALKVRMLVACLVAWVFFCKPS
jgi:hypothetical protein